MSWITDEARAEMAAINANLSHTRRGPAGAKYLRMVDGVAVWCDDPAPVVKHSMFPYVSTAMCVDPEDVPQVTEQLRKQGVLVEFDREGRPLVTSTKQQSELAKALGMKTGRDGYGHTDQYGRFQHSGRNRGKEMQQGRAKVKKAIAKLEAMPEESPPDAVASVLREFDIAPSEDNTG